MTPLEDEYAAAVAAAIAEDVHGNPPDGPLVRVVLRWFEEGDPLYCTLHALGANERDAVPPEDAWYPLEWPNADIEIDRWERVVKEPEVQRTGEVLAAYYGEHEDDEEGEWGPSPATVEVVRRLPAALRSAGVDLTDDFAAAAAHFEGWGARAILKEVADRRLLRALRKRGELPEE
ncbi:MAG TPA: hypothetical protein VFX51_10415 [Solirubrobacteraceae bacterium]|nr:hypothetical protein [Solirubrobacteraceae bacterium]